MSFIKELSLASPKPVAAHSELRWVWSVLAPERIESAFSVGSGEIERERARAQVSACAAGQQRAGEKHKPQSASQTAD